MTIIETVSALFTNDGAGGIVVIIVIALAVVIYAWLIRWIIQGGEHDEGQGYDQT